MKKLLVILLIIAAINGIVIVLFMSLSRFNSDEKEDAVYIALAGPMSGIDKENGDDMVRGVRLCLEKFCPQNKFKGKKIELLVFDDKDRRTAIQIATQLAGENKVLLVLGHYRSSNSITAGAIYKKSGIPAITASASVESITSENEWYFSTIPKNRFSAAFIAAYMKKALNRTSASMIYDKNEYGSDLARHFEAETAIQGITIKNKWEIDGESETAAQEMKNTIGQLRSAEETGMVFYAVFAGQGADFLASSRYPGTDYPVMGPDSFANTSFAGRFKGYPGEQISPGYYSDGIYAASPFIAEVGGEEALDFRKNFIAKYGREPSWVGACYYDAMLVALTAVEKAEIQGQDIREDRRRVRDALNRVNSRDVAVKGVSGDIYFDVQGASFGNVMMGIWHKGQFLPAFRQYSDMSGHGVGDTPTPSVAPGPAQKDKAALDDDFITVDSQILTGTRVVYAGIDINKIYNLDMEKGTYTADFYLWFRFQGKFDDTGITFPDAVNPVKLGEPVMTERSKEDITVRSYRVIADFKTVFDLYAYPFDRQVLRISLHNTDQSRTKLIYVPDFMGLSEADPVPSRRKDIGKRMIQPIEGWKVSDMSLFQDILTLAGSDKHASSYSRMNLDIRIERKDLTSLFLKNFSPLMVIAIMLYMVYLIPPDRLSVRAWIFIPSLAVLGAIHYSLMILSPGRRLFEYAVFAGYVLAVISIFISVPSAIIRKRSSDGKRDRLTLFGKILHIVFMLAAGIVIAYMAG
jgi:ABC-type branched-subunit amino acid transport system substrate-binding protein